MTASCFFDPTHPSRSPLGTDHDVGLPTLVAKSCLNSCSAPLRPLYCSLNPFTPSQKLSTRSSLPAAFHAFSGQALIQSP
jgi:hypothetical protein